MAQVLRQGFSRIAKVFQYFCSACMWQNIPRSFERTFVYKYWVSSENDVKTWVHDHDLWSWSNSSLVCAHGATVGACWVRKVHSQARTTWPLDYPATITLGLPLEIPNMWNSVHQSLLWVSPRSCVTGAAPSPLTDCSHVFIIVHVPFVALRLH